MLRPFLDHVGLFLDVLEVLERLGGSWGGLGDALAVSWAPAASKTHFQTPEAPPASLYSPSLGANLGPKTRPWGGLGAILGVLGPSWGRLEPSWANLGPFLWPSGETPKSLKNQWVFHVF